MAKIKPSALVSEITGSIAATTFRRTPSGISAYNAPRKIKRDSPRAQQVRNAQTALIAQWDALSDDDKRIYESIAANSAGYKLDSDSKYTARQYWIAQNMVSALNGNAGQVDARGPGRAISQFSPTFLPTTTKIEVNTGDSLAIVKWDIYGATWFSTQPRAHVTRWHFLFQYPGTAGSQPVDITAEWTAKLPLPKLGQFCAIGLRFVTGASLPPVLQTAQAAATL